MVESYMMKLHMSLAIRAMLQVNTCSAMKECSCSHRARLSNKKLS